jgi:hypothetical protein
MLSQLAPPLVFQAVGVLWDSVSRSPPETQSAQRPLELITPAPSALHTRATDLVSNVALLECSASIRQKRTSAQGILNMTPDGGNLIFDDIWQFLPIICQTRSTIGLQIILTVDNFLGATMQYEFRTT